MRITLLATGSPIPLIARGGSSVVISIDDEPLLVDCGPRTVLRMLEVGIDPAVVETLFFTHHHVDHNADFFEFVIGSWSLGRRALSVYGPEGTEDFLRAPYDLYEDDIDYREWFYGTREGIDDIEVHRTTGDLSVTTETWSATALPVEHSIETYAYRFGDLSTGESCVVSGDTRRIDELADFAEGADTLIQDCCIAPAAEDPSVEAVYRERHTRPLSDEARRKHEQNHCDPEDAGRIADRTGVDTLVLTHLLPYRDHDAMRERAGSVFDGTVVVAQDGMRLDLDP